MRTSLQRLQKPDPRLLIFNFCHFPRPLAGGKDRAGAAVAQMVEHVIRNDGVVGSSPISGTTSS